MTMQLSESYLGFDGPVIVKGLMWSEDPPFRLARLIAIPAVTALACGWLFATRQTVFAGSVPWWFFASVVLCVAAALEVSIYIRPGRWLNFRSDGEIEVPEGIPGDQKRRRLGQHRRIASFESHRCDEHSFGVKIVSVSGNSFWISRDLSEGKATHIAVQLTMLLLKIRGGDAGTREPREEEQIIY